MAHDNWQKLAQQKSPSLNALFDAAPARVDDLSFNACGMWFDFSKTHLDAAMLRQFEGMAHDCRMTEAIVALLSGEIVNPSEGRAAEHTAERGVGSEAAVAKARVLQERMRVLVSAIDEGVFGEIRHIIHLGIGGSALGPEMLMRALSTGEDRYDVAIVSNIDGMALQPVLLRFDPAKTLVVIASKSFTTAETFLNADSVLDWMAEAGVDDPRSRVIALTAKPEKASEWGVDDSRILPFAESVGGRYSLWSSIGFPIALALGFETYAALLEGGGEMDRHFRDAPLMENLPVLAAFTDRYYAVVRGCQTRALFAYDERLALVPDYLQQLEMESNGKSVTLDGGTIDQPSAMITWGGVGTDAQHAVFQLLHQGTHLIPVEFLAVIEPGDDLDPAHHEGLLLNAFAQGAALMAGKASDDPNRNYPGDRPSVTILLDRLDARTLGALIAFYEHRTYANAVLMGINPFDQFGVELGKEMAHRLSDGGGDALDPSTEALKARAFPA